MFVVMIGVGASVLFAKKKGGLAMAIQLIFIVLGGLLFFVMSWLGFT